MPTVTFTQDVISHGTHYAAGQQADVPDADMEHLTKHNLIQQAEPKTANARSAKADSKDEAKA